MIRGAIILEDINLSFEANSQDLTVTFWVEDTKKGISEYKTVPQNKFFAALAIAVHNDGTPDWKLDYPAAESVMGNIRWIP